MENIKLSPAAISKLLDIDLDLVIHKITGKKADTSLPFDEYRKTLIHIRKKYKNELYDLDSIPVFKNKDAVSDDLNDVCILRLIISQYNSSPVTLMKKVVSCKKCVELIKFTDKFMFYDMFLTVENQNLILNKVADVHLHEIGNSKIYKDFISSHLSLR